jgi:hypothetical protein
MKKGGVNEYRSNIDRNATVGPLAYLDWFVIPGTSCNTLSSYGSPGHIGRDPVVDRKITNIEQGAGTRTLFFS